MQGIATVLQARGFRTHVQDSQLGSYQIGRVSRPRNTRTSIRLNAVRSMPETDGIVGESNLAKTGGPQARAVHGTIASDADRALRLMCKPGAACSSLVYLGHQQIDSIAFSCWRRCPRRQSRDLGMTR
jgi:hypothetical protein